MAWGTFIHVCNTQPAQTSPMHPRSPQHTKTSKHPRRCPHLRRHERRGQQGRQRKVAVVVDPLECGARRVGKDELVHRCRRCCCSTGLRQWCRQGAVERQRCPCPQGARRPSLANSEPRIAAVQQHGTLAGPHSAPRPASRGPGPWAPRVPLPARLLAIPSALPVSMSPGPAPKCGVPAVARSLPAGFPGLIRGSAVSGGTAGVRVSGAGLLAGRMLGGGAARRRPAATCQIGRAGVWRAFRSRPALSRRLSPPNSELWCASKSPGLQACSANPAAHPPAPDPMPANMTAAADAAPAREAAAACAAAVAAAASPPAADAQQPSTVEAAFPGSFCAELWQSTRDVYGCVLRRLVEPLRGGLAAAAGSSASRFWHVWQRQLLQVATDTTAACLGAVRCHNDVAAEPCSVSCRDRRQPLFRSLTRITLLDNPLPAPSWRTPSCGALWTAACPRRRSASTLFRTFCT